jgi:glycine cleavage system H protein
MATYPTNYRYSKDHEWVSVDDDTATIGITSFAQHELGEVVFVELPEVGSAFDAGDEVGTIESVKAVAEVYTPLAGEVIEINEAVAEDPELINDEPQGAGWLFKLRVSDLSALAELMDSAAYEKYLAEQES